MILKLRVLFPFLAAFLFPSRCVAAKSRTENDKEAYRILNTVSDLPFHSYIYYRTLNIINCGFVL